MYQKAWFNGVRSDLQETVNTYATSIGHQAELGNISYQEGEFSVKLTFRELPADGTPVEQALWNRHCMELGLDKEWFGQDVINRGETFKVVGLSITSRSKKVLIQGRDGRRYRCAPEFIQTFYRAQANRANLPESR